MIIFGAGIRGRRCLQTLREAGISTDFFCDNSRALWGTEVAGITVISPEQLKKAYLHEEIVIANKKNPEEIREQLLALGADKVRTLEESIFSHTRLSFLGEDSGRVFSPARAKEPLGSVVILGRGEVSPATRRSIAEQDGGADWEILTLRESRQGIRGEKVLLLRNGDLLQSGALGELVELQRERGGIAGSKSVDREGKICQAGYILEGEARVRRYGFGESGAAPEYEYVRAVDAVSASGLLMDSAVYSELCRELEEEERLPELGVRISLLVREKGQGVWFTPFSVVLEEKACEESFEISSGKLTEACRRYLDDVGEGSSLFWRANREGGSCRALVADFGIAQFDKNAGNRSTYHYIQTFQRLGMWIVYLIDDFYYEYKYVKIFQKQGIYVLYGEEWSRSWQCRLPELLPEIGYVFLNRPLVAAKYVELIRKYSRALVVHYGHDLHYLRLGREYEITGEAKLLEESRRLKEIEYSLVPKVDITGYPSAVEVELMKREFPRAEIQNFPLYFYEGELPELRTEGRQGILFVGGFAHSPNEDAAVWLVEEILPRLRKQGITDKVYLAGSNPTDKIRSLAGEDIIVTGYVSDEELQAYYEQCFVDVLPLRYGAGMKGKLLEAMYEGIPVVTTDIGAEGLEGLEGIAEIGNTAEEIAKKVIMLYSERERLSERMQAEREYMRRNFSRERMQTLIERQLTWHKRHQNEERGDSDR